MLNFTSDPVDKLLEATFRQLLRDLNDASDPRDKEQLAGAVAHIQKAIKDGLSQGGGGNDGIIDLLLAEAQHSTNQKNP